MKNKGSEPSPAPDIAGLAPFNGDRRFAQSLARGLSVLRAFKPGDDPLGNQELAQRTGLSKATVSRLTFTLTQLGYLEHLNRLEKYRLGSGVLALGNTANASLPFIDMAAEIMQNLADEVKALVAIAVPDGSRMLMTHGWRPSQSPSLWLQLGTRIPMTRSAVGLAYLASIGTRERHHLVRTVLSTTPQQADQIYADVEEARIAIDTMGYVPSFGRWTSAIYAAATPYRSPMLGAPYIFFSGVGVSSMDHRCITEVIGPELATRVRQLRGD